jgi:hypothetical protein
MEEGKYGGISMRHSTLDNRIRETFTHFLYNIDKYNNDPEYREKVLKYQKQRKVNA